MTATVKVSSDASVSPGKSISIKVVTISITTLTSTIQWTKTVDINGEVVAIQYDMPTFADYPHDMAFNFKDEDSIVWHNKTGIITAQHTLETLYRDSAPRRFPFVGTATLQATTVALSAAQGIEANIVLYIKHDS